MRWWSAPKQRQRWGKSEILPTDNWGQIFFDLFYVAGCINLGNILKEVDDDGSYGKSILYFLGLGLPAMMMWFDKLYYDARFTTRPGHDVLHRLLEVIQIGNVATALSRLRPVKIMSNCCEHSDMFQFSASTLFYSIITLAKYREVSLFVVGDPSAKVAAWRVIKWRVVPTLFCFAATLESGVAFFRKDANEDNEFCTEIGDRPVYYLLASWISWAFIGYLDTVLFAPKQQTVDFAVPMNIQFCVHRYGEWFMLMFGESVISLLIVDGMNESLSYNIAFFSGILSVIFLAHLHFGSQPRALDRHALSRSRHSSYVYTILVPLYSAALIAIGVCYKLFLYEFSSYQKGYETGNDQSEANVAYADYTDDPKQRSEQYAASLFSGSIATVLICMDLQQLLHHGSAEIQRRARLVSVCTLIVFTLLKYFLIIFLATLSLHQTDPHIMAFCGLGAILLQEFLRSFSFHNRGQGQPGETSKEEKASTNDDDDATWMTTTSISNLSFVSQDANECKAYFAVFERETLLELDGLSVVPEGDETSDGSTYKELEDDLSASKCHKKDGIDDLQPSDYSRMAEI